jgi:hypothetical protein
MVTVDADLAAMTRNGKSVAAHYSAAEREHWHAMLTHIAAARGYKPGWSWHKYREKFGTSPPRHVMPIAPTPEVLSWVRSRAIAWAKSRRAA